MASRFFSDFKEKKVSGSKGAKPTGKLKSLSGTEKTANWPGLPGKSGPDRSGGDKKVRIHPKSTGI